MDTKHCALHVERSSSTRVRASDSRLRGPRFEACAAVLKPWASFFTLHRSSSLNCINEYLAIDKWWSSLRTLIVTYGQMLQREVKMVPDLTGLSGK